eukprot:2657889-Pyramimonas_sp.AAC.1
MSQIEPGADAMGDSAFNFGPQLEPAAEASDAQAAEDEAAPQNQEKKETQDSNEPPKQQQKHVKKEATKTAKHVET